MTPDNKDERAALEALDEAMGYVRRGSSGVMINSETIKFCHELLTRKSPAIPEGFCLVPIEPTQSMLFTGAGNDAARKFVKDFGDVTIGCAGEIYNAMLAAAPPPPAASIDDGEGE
jgi:hypothetical protein